jgi:hypothetical protein
VLPHDAPSDNTLTEVNGVSAAYWSGGNVTLSDAIELFMVIDVFLIIATAGFIVVLAVLNQITRNKIRLPELLRPRYRRSKS